MTEWPALPTLVLPYAAVDRLSASQITRVRQLLQEEPMPRLNPARIVALAGVLVLIVLSGVQISAASARRFPRQADTTVYEVGHGVKAPVLLHEVKPDYTESAKKRKVQGTVQMQEVVTTEGTVRDIRVTKSLDPDLDAQAVKAAQQWRFQPGTKDGTPVNVRVFVELTFTLK